MKRFFPALLGLVLAICVAAALFAATQSWDTLTTVLHPGLVVEPPEAPYRTPAGTLAGASFEDQLVEIVNQERLNNGMLPPLKKNDLLDNSSETHSLNMGTRNFFAHCDPDTGLDPFERMTAAGYIWNFAGENIAAGTSTPSSTMVLWMGSTAGHRDNILETNFREIGVGYVNDVADVANVRGDMNGDCVSDTFGGGPFFHYWTQNFGKRNNVFPVVINREAYETSSTSVSLYVYGTDFVATEMRFKNESGAWSAWEPYNANKAWTLSGGGGLKEVFAEIRNGVGTVRQASDTIILNGPSLPAQFHTVDPCRLVDTRSTDAPALDARQSRTFTIAGKCGIPAAAKAISVNLVATGSTLPGNLRLFPAGGSVPEISSINYPAGQTRSNNAVVVLSASGLAVFVGGQASGTVHFVLDVNGYFE